MMKYVVFAFACFLATTAPAAVAQQDQREPTLQPDNGRIVVASTKVADRDFWIDGRARNSFVLHFTRDDQVCPKFLTAMNEPMSGNLDGPFDYDNRELSSLFLGSRYNIGWSHVGAGSVRYAEVDIDNDGTRDHVYSESGSLGSGILFEKMYWTSTPPGPGGLSAAYVEMSMQSAKRGQNIIAAASIVLTPDAIDWGASAPSDDSDWGLGSFKDVVSIDGRSYVIAGGATSRTVGQDWFPVRLIEIHGHDRHRLICELLPKYQNVSRQ